MKFPHTVALNKTSVNTQRQPNTLTLPSLDTDILPRRLCFAGGIAFRVEALCKPTGNGPGSDFASSASFAARRSLSASISRKAYIFCFKVHRQVW